MDAESFAILQAPSGKVLMGIGPFQELAECPHQGVAFYVNNFSLTEPRPWKVPSAVVEFDPAEMEGMESPVIEWEALEPDGFAQVFSEINESIQKGVLEKSVPVATERGSLKGGTARGLLNGLVGSGDQFYPYAWVDGASGFCGQTPELLFHLRKGRLKTMALAGTARAEDRSVFAFDEKEIREHEYVAQTLVASLSDIGMVKRGERRMMDLGKLVHFHTPIEVFMYGDHAIDYLVRKMHPTPALGPHPRTPESLELLYEWRSRLGAPRGFGAPFGVYDHGEFHAVVAIRGIYWEGEQVAVPSGCGVIEASRLTNEWRELALKRSAVKACFGI
ncbi:chorismate-binding protein [Rubritalea tangerina]|uniref:Chorismate-binding protein n=2 Tax=Rubritalea tangerina TaxID=430798 RepID=A0ABW4ZBQ7_9BACT